jgi:hypothetical protein
MEFFCSSMCHYVFCCLLFSCFFFALVPFTFTEQSNLAFRTIVPVSQSQLMAYSDRYIYTYIYDYMYVIIINE